MKKLSIEEKAKAYDKAIKVARFKMRNDKDHVLYEEDITDIFPELKESEDEKIRKSLIELFKDMEWDDSILHDYNMDKDKTIAWLEKQGEHKPFEWSQEDAIRLQRIIDFLWYNRKGDTDTIYQQELDIDWLKSIKDRIQSKQSSKPQGKSATEAIKKEKVDNANKVESKFKVGDWVVRKDGKNFHDSKTIQFTKTDENACQFGSIRRLYEDKIRHWTIADAQDGDVLVASDGSIFIFAGVVDCACKYYITLTATNDVKINKEKKGGYWETSRAVYPATKEQRDLLFQKMKESGWGFDFEKKELKKIMEK